jgi:hypothetical protein
MPDPSVALRRWIRLLRPQGFLAPVEGRWSNNAGLAADQAVALVMSTGRSADITVMSDPVCWGRPIDDGRYILVSAARSGRLS